MDKEKIVLPIGGVPMKLTRELPTYHKRIAGYRENKNTYDGQMVHMCFLNENFASEIIRKHSEFEEYDEMYRRMVFFNPTEGQVEQEEKKRIEQVFNWYVYHQNQNVYINHQTIDSRNQFAIVERIVQSNLSYLQRFYPKTHQYLTQMPDSSVFHEFNQNIIQYKNQLLEQFYREFHGIHESVQPFVLNSMIERKEKAKKLAAQVERAYTPMSENVRENQIEEGDYAERGQNAVLTYRRMESTNVWKEKQLSGQKELPVFQKNFAERQVAEVEKKLIKSLTRKEMEEKNLTEMLEKKETAEKHLTEELESKETEEKNLTETLVRKGTEEKNRTETLARKEAEEKNLTETFVRKEMAGAQSEKENSQKEWMEKAGSWEPQDYSVKKQVVLGESGKAELEQGKTGQRARELGEELKSKYGEIQQGRAAEKLAVQVEKAYVPMSEKVRENQVEERDYAEAGQNEVLTYRRMESADFQKEEQLPGQKELPSFQKNFVEKNVSEVEKKLTESLTRKEMEEQSLTQMLEKKETAEKYLTEELERKETEEKNLTETLVRKETEEKNHTETLARKEATEKNLTETLAGRVAEGKNLAETFVRREIAGLQREKESSAKEWMQKAGSWESQDYSVRKQEVLGGNGKAELEQGKAGQRARELGEELKSKYGEIRQGREAEKLAVQVERAYVPMTEKVRENQIEEGDYAEAGQNDVLTYRRMESANVQKEEQLPGQKELPSFQKNFVEKQVAEVEKKLTESLTRKEMEEQSLTEMLEKKETAEKYLTEELERKEKTEKNLTEPLARKEAEERNLTETLARKEAEERNLTEAFARKEETEQNLTEAFVRRGIAGLQSEKDNSQKEWREKAGSLELQDYSVKKQEVLGGNGKAELEQGKAGQRARELGEELKSKYGEIRQGREAEKLAVQVERAYVPMTEKVRENQIEEGDYAEAGQNEVLTYRRMESANFQKEEQLPGQKELPSFQKNFVEKQVAEVEKKLTESLTRKEMEEQSLTEMLEKKETVEKHLTEELARKETEEKNLTETLARKEETEKNLTETFVRREIAGLQSEKENSPKEWREKEGSWELQDYSVKKQEVLGESGKAELEQGKAGERARELGEELKSKYGEIRQGREAEKLAVQVERAYVPMTEKVRENQIEERDYAEAGQNEILTYRRMESADVQKEEQLAGQKELPSFQKNFVEKQVAEVEKKLTESLTGKKTEEKNLMQMLEKKEMAEKYLTEELERKETEEKNLTEKLTRKEATEKKLIEELVRKETAEKNRTETLAKKGAEEKNLTETFVRREMAGAQREKENRQKEWLEKAGSLEPQDYSVKKKEVLGESGKAELEQGKAGQRARELGEELISKYEEIQQEREAEKLAVQVERAYVPMTEKVRENQVEERDYAEAGQSAVMTYRRMESANVQKEEQLSGQKELPSFQKNFVEKQVAEVEKKLIDSLARKETAEKNLTQMLEKKETAEKHLTEKLERKETEEKTLTETLARKEAEEKHLTETLVRKEAAGLQSEKENRSKEWKEKAGSWESQDYSVKKQAVLEANGKANLEQGKAGLRARELGEELKSKYEKIEQGRKAEKLARHVERTYEPMTEKVSGNQIGEGDYKKADQNAVLTYRTDGESKSRKEKTEKQTVQSEKKSIQSLNQIKGNKESKRRPGGQKVHRAKSKKRRGSETDQNAVLTYRIGEIMSLQMKNLFHKPMSEKAVANQVREADYTETGQSAVLTYRTGGESNPRSEAQLSVQRVVVERQIAESEKKITQSLELAKENIEQNVKEVRSREEKRRLDPERKEWANLEKGQVGTKARKLGENLWTRYTEIEHVKEVEKLASKVVSSYVRTEDGKNAVLTFRMGENPRIMKELITKEMEEQKVQGERESGRSERFQLEKGQTGTKAKELGEMVQKKYEELKNETSDGKPEQNNFEKKQPAFIFRNIMYQQREGDDNFWEEIGAEISLAQNNLTDPGLSNSSDIFAKYNRYNEQHSNRAGRGRTSSKSQILEGLKEFMQQIQSRLYEKDNQILLEQKNQEILFEQIEQQNHILREMIEQQMDLKQQMEELRDSKRSRKEDNREFYRKMELEQKRYGLDV